MGAMKRGTLIHQLLELLPDVAIPSREGAARKFLEKHKLGSETDGIWDQIKTILNDEKIAPLFGPNSRAEVPIAGVIGTQPFTASLDRLLVMDDEVWIVDYKTNRTPPSDISKIPTLYLKQIAFYKNALQTIFGAKKIRPILLWTEGAKWVEISDAALKKYNPQ